MTEETIMAAPPDERKMNVLVLGASGAGKSTLIKAISGAKILTGYGAPSTEKIDVYESETWPLRFIDTKGFEYKRSEQRKTLKQIREYTKSQLENPDSDSDEVGIDAVWYCVEGTSRRTFAHNIELMNRAIRGWKGVPVFAVITKSYSQRDISENVEAVALAFAKAKKINLQKIIPVVAEEYYIFDEVKVEPMGIAELCSATLGCVDTAKSINRSNRDRMVLEQKRYTANTIVSAAAATAATIGAVPFNFAADSALLVPLETLLTKSILKHYKVDFPGDLVSAIVGSAAITNIAKAAITPLKALPIAGNIVNGVVAGGIVFALGKAVIAAAEAMYTGKIDPHKIDEIKEYIEKRIEQSPVMGTIVKYLEENVDNLPGRSARDIIEGLQDVLKRK